MKQKLTKIIAGGFLLLGFSVLAAAQVVPIIEMRSGGLLGGVENGKYLDAKTVFGKIKGEGKYSLYGLTGRTGELTATIEPPDVPCEEFYYAKTQLEGQKGVAIGANRSWNAAPRTPKSVNLKDKTYLNIVSGVLRSKGLSKAKAVIEQAVKIDLDGDGVDEVVLTASSYGGKISPGAKANDYSFVLLRKIVGGKAQNIFLSEEYIKKYIEFGAPSRFEIASVVDLNGDGKMEIVVYGEYYEGSGANVYEIKGDKAVEIKMLETGCGV